MSRQMGQSEHDLIKNYGAPVVGETCDWSLNDLTRDDALQQSHVYEAFEKAKSGAEVEEGISGGGTGCFAASSREALVLRVEGCRVTRRKASIQWV